MATIIETSVGVTIELRRSGGVDTVHVNAQSAAAGTPNHQRSLVDQNVTAIVPPDLMLAIKNLLDAGEAWAKAQLQIP